MMEMVPIQQFIEEVYTAEGVRIIIGAPVGAARRTTQPPKEAVSYIAKFDGRYPLADRRHGSDVIKRVLTCLDDNYIVQMIHPLSRQPWITGRNAHLSTIRSMMARTESRITI